MGVCANYMRLPDHIIYKMYTAMLKNNTFMCGILWSGGEMVRYTFGFIIQKP